MEIKPKKHSQIGDDGEKNCKCDKDCKNCKVEIIDFELNATKSLLPKIN